MPQKAGNYMSNTNVESNNIELIRKGFEAFAAGNMAVLGELFDSNANWHGVAAGVLKGEYRGREAVFAMFALLHHETGGTFHTKPVAMAAAGDKVFVQTEISGERNGRKLNDGEVIVFTLVDKRVSAVHLYTANYPDALAFWS